MNRFFKFSECSDLNNNNSVDAIGEIIKIVWGGETVELGQLPHMVSKSIKLCMIYLLICLPIKFSIFFKGTHSITCA